MDTQRARRTSYNVKINFYGFALWVGSAANSDVLDEPSDVHPGTTKREVLRELREEIKSTPPYTPVPRTKIEFFLREFDLPPGENIAAYLD